MGSSFMSIKTDGSYLTLRQISVCDRSLSKVGHSYTRITRKVVLIKAASGSDWLTSHDDPYYVFETKFVCFRPESSMMSFTYFVSWIYWFSLFYLSLSLSLSLSSLVLLRLPVRVNPTLEIVNVHIFNVERFLFRGGAIVHATQAHEELPIRH